MVDLHCHLLPFVDDGPQSMQDCLGIVHAAVKSGVTHLVASPHHLNGKYVNRQREILFHVHELNQSLQKENIPLVIYPGQEVRIHQNLLALLEKSEILTINHGRYLLLEFPHHEVPIYTSEIIYELLIKGIIPIIVHPERNRVLLENPRMIYDLVEEGALMQITAGSILGVFGRNIKNLSYKLIEHQLVHVIATDAHNLSGRRILLREAYEQILRSFGREQVHDFKKNAEHILHNREVRIKEPTLIRKPILSIFRL